MEAAILDCELLGVKIAPLSEHSDVPLLVTPIEPVFDAVSWASENNRAANDLVLKHGAVLFRGFGVQGPTQFESFVSALCADEWVEYREASTPRSTVQGHVATSTEYPPEFRIYVHNENSHVTSWPQYIFFHCAVPAEQGGHTPIADCRRVYQRLPTDLVDRFTESGWLYRRNFHAGSSFTWQKTFNTDSRAGVERYCEENYMLPQWKGSALTIWYRRWAALRHPRTADALWFNHGTFFNPYVLEPAMKSTVLSMGEDRMPYNTYFGDGERIPEETLRTLDAAYSAETVSFPWEAGDVLMLDNMRIAHGRTSYKGQRKVLVTMKSKIRCTDVAEYRHYSVPQPANLPV